MQKNIFLNFLERIGRKRIILDRDSKDPYLVRYYLFLKDRKTFPFNIFLHQFLMSDPTDLHDHPWPFFSFILKGGYWEWVPVYKDDKIVGERKIWRGAGSCRFRGAETYHRIELDPNVDCWTLFIPGPQKRDWGFLTHDTNKDEWDNLKWVQHEGYIQDKQERM